MKTRQPLAAIAVLLLFVLLAGCAPSAPEPLPPLEVAQAEASPTPPPIPTGVATATFTPSVTPSATSSATPSVTPPPSATPTDYPTRTPAPSNTPRPTWTPFSSSSSSSGSSSSSSSSSTSSSDDDKQGKPNGQAGLNTLNKVANPNFTTGKYTYTASGVSVPDVPTDWTPWTAGVWPQYYQEGNPQHIFDDFAAWSFTTAYEKMRGGLYQVFFDLQPGAVYRANCWMFAYAGSGTTGTPSEGFVRMKLGIDPKAGTNVNSSSVVWGIEHANMLGSVTNVINDVYTARDVYDPYTVIFTAISPAATIWIWAEGDYAYNRSVVTVDSCEMRAIGWASDFGLPSP